MTAPDLLPCRCGGKVHIDHFKNPKAVVVVCEKCGTDWLGYWSDSEQSIAERWNTRATPAAMTPEVAKLVEAMKALEKAAAEVSRRGAETGPQWTKLTVALLQARTTLAELKG